jgi:hypothetical protein
MGGWKYRLCSYTVDGETLFSIREVYYKPDGTVRGIVIASTEAWTTPQEVAKSLDLMRAATELPVLQLD